MRSDIADIREQVAQLRAALLSPGVEAIEGCIPVLQQAAERLRLIDPNSLAPHERAEVSLLKHDLLRVQTMATSGLAFWQGWARIVAAQSGAAAGVSAGYTALGNTAETGDGAGRRRFKVDG